MRAWDCMMSAGVGRGRARAHRVRGAAPWCGRFVRARATTDGMDARAMPYGTDLTAMLCTAVASATAGAALMRGCMAGPAPHQPVSRCPAKARQNQSTPDGSRERLAIRLDTTNSGVSGTGPDVEIEYCTVRQLPSHCDSAMCLFKINLLLTPPRRTCRAASGTSGRRGWRKSESLQNFRCYKAQANMTATRGSRLPLTATDSLAFP